jgi:hypothetical protein
MSAGKGKRGAVKEIGPGGVQEYFDEQVAAHGGLSEVFDNFVGQKGRPDRVVTWKSRGSAQIDFVELKTIGGRLESWQERDHKRRRKLGCHVEVLWSKAMVDDYIWRRCPWPTYGISK